MVTRCRVILAPGASAFAPLANFAQRQRGRIARIGFPCCVGDMLRLIVESDSRTRVKPVFTFLPVVMLLAACASTASLSPCMPGEERSVMDTVYFGTGMPDGEVSPEDWRSFRDNIVTPRFPEGLTSFKADGQWRNNAGETVSESTYVVQVVHPDSAQIDAAVREVASLYKTRFRQEAVLRVRSASCISFSRASG
jgi:Protein of unknown function (DUF3574)